MAFHCVCQYQRGQLGGDIGHVVQVRASLQSILGPSDHLVRSLLFTGLLINRDTVVPALQWLHTVSFFHAAFEALAVNELRYLQLKEIKVSPTPSVNHISISGL
jgi:hypothetical protein